MITSEAIKKVLYSSHWDYFEVDGLSLRQYEDLIKGGASQRQNYYSHCGPLTSRKPPNLCRLLT